MVLSLEKVHLLDEYTINQIAAGEIIENPASIIKELVENSMDADSSAITVEIKEGGKKFIRVTDNGIGMTGEDAKLSLLRHATSKISDSNDLEMISTLGFRGEALASIAAVTQFEMLTRARENISGTHIVNHGGKMIDVKEVGCPEGTTIIVQNLFYNTPARLKFLKSTRAESAKISDIISKLIMANPDVSIKYINNEKTIYHSPGNGKLLSAIMTIYGTDICDNILELTDKDTNNKTLIEGYIGKPLLTRANRIHQSFFVNGRYVDRSDILTKALEDAYKGYITVNSYPWAIISITMPAHLIDVNIHPAKTEIRFKDEKFIYETVFKTVKKSLESEEYIPNIQPSRNEDMSEESNSQLSYIVVDDVPSEIIDKPYDDHSDRRDRKSEHTNYQERKTVHIVEENIDNGRINSQDVVHNIANRVPYRLIGTLFSTYILLEGEDSLYIIDQHAAHERILYEKFKNARLDGEIAVQIVNPPIVVDVTHNEKNILVSSLNTFLKLGFDIEFFGGNTFIIRGIPAFLEGANIKELFFDILDTVVDENPTHPYIIEENNIISSACKKAIKAHDMLSDSEIRALFAQLENMDIKQLTCPHGRPIMIKLTRYELEKYFKRIV